MIVAIIQARTESTRLPSKVLKLLRGQPLIAHVVERVRHAALVDRLLVATTTRPADDALVDWCAGAGIDCFRGHEHDVLDRYLRAAIKYGATSVVRVTGDCPLIDPGVIDQVIAQFQSGELDYVSNVDPPTFPDGLDVEVIATETLQCAAQEATLPSDREHVTTFIRQRPDRFRLGCVRHDPDLADHRWTVDEPEDWQLVEAIYEQLPEKHYDMASVLEILARQPQLREINRAIRRNAGYCRSLVKDERAENGPRQAADPVRGPEPS